MALWNNRDREESKPTWLNASQKVRCIRTVAGWELPLDGTSLGGQLAGVAGATSLTFSTPFMELLVAMPMDPSNTGITSSFYANRISATGGLANASDTPNYLPYFTCPFSGDSATAGGFDGLGLSFANSVTGTGAGYGSYAVNAYGVSTPTSWVVKLPISKLLQMTAIPHRISLSAKLLIILVLVEISFRAQTC